MDVRLLTCPASSLPAAEHPGSSGAAPRAQWGSWRWAGREGLLHITMASVARAGGPRCGQKT